MSRKSFNAGALLAPVPPALVSCGTEENPNVLTIGWTGIICTKPPMTYISVRPERHSYNIIKQTGEFVINLASENLCRAVDYCGVRSGKNTDKFKDCKPLRSDNGLVVLPRYINSFMSLKVEQYIDLDTHGMFICSVTESRVISDRETMTYTYYQNNVKPKPQTEGKKGYVCKICGYVYEGDTLPDDFVCPLCKHGAADFEPIK